MKQIGRVEVPQEAFVAALRLEDVTPTSLDGVARGRPRTLLAEDVALHLARAAADRQRPRVEVAVVPRRSRLAPNGPRSSEQPVGARELDGQRHHVLAVLVGERLAHRRLRARLEPSHCAESVRSRISRSTSDSM